MNWMDLIPSSGGSDCIWWMNVGHLTNGAYLDGRNGHEESVGSLCLKMGKGWEEEVF